MRRRTWLRSVGWIGACVAFAGHGLAQVPKLHLQPRVVPAKAAAAAEFAWPTDYARASARATERSVPLLLFFTAKWCGPCQRMKSTVLLDPVVQRALANVQPVLLDIDVPANVPLQRCYGDPAIPTFAVVDGTGALMHRWIGASTAEEFLAELATGLTATKDVAASTRRRGVVALLEAAGKGDEAVVERAFAELRQEAGATSDPAQVWTQACELAELRRDFAGVVAAANRCLPLLRGEARTAMEWRRDRAEFECRGVTSAVLAARIDALVLQLATPIPGRSLFERAARAVNAAAPVDNAAFDAAIARHDEASAQLAALGPVAAPALYRALRNKPGESLSHARLLARLRAPGVVDQLRRDLVDPELPVWCRAPMAACLAGHKDIAALPLLLELAGPAESPMVRGEALQGIKELALQMGGADRVDIAEVVGSAFDTLHAGLLREALQTAMQVRAPLPLDALADLLADRRPLFRDFVIGDNALWVLLEQIGMLVADEAGAVQEQRATPAVRACVQQWLHEHQARLQWSVERGCYLVAG